MEKEYVYATAYNIKKTLRSIKFDKERLDSKIISDIILNKNLYLSDENFNNIKVLYIFLEDPILFIKDYFRGWEDTYTFLIEDAPAYHLKSDCYRFLHDFYNVKIPVAIKEKKLVEEARLWARQNNGLLNASNIGQFKENFVKHFNHNFDLALNILDLEPIDRPNSGMELVKNDISDIINDINNLLKLFEASFTNDKIKFYQREFSGQQYKYKNEYKPQSNYIEHKIFYDLMYIKNSFVIPINKLINDYIILKLNNEHKYDQSVLKVLNFRQCLACL